MTFALRVLVVDDHDTNRLILRRQAERLGCYVVEAANGEEALLFLADETFDLIITDCQMPVMDGIELSRAVRAGDTNVIIWGLTANAQASERVRCIDAGMNECFFKPLLPEDLKHHLVKAFNLNKKEAVNLSYLFDFRRLRDITGENSQHLVMLLEKAFENNHTDLASLIDNLQVENITNAASIVHRMVGSADVLGATFLRENLRTIEMLLNNGEAVNAYNYSTLYLTDTILSMDKALITFKAEQIN